MSIEQQQRPALSGLGRGRAKLPPGMEPSFPPPPMPASTGPPKPYSVSSPSTSNGVTPAAGGDAGGASETDEPAPAKAEVSFLNKILHSKLVPITSSVEVERRNPDSPLYSVKTFEALHLRHELRKGVYNMGFTYPSKIQETALPTLLADPPQNMIAQSQSGTGKTAAFVLAALSRVQSEFKHPQVLCLAPTYELALQIGQVFEKMAKYCEDIRLRYAVRGQRVDRGDQISEQVVVGTPGTVMDWLLKFKVMDPQNIKVFILDEADVMISQQGHQDQSIRVHKLLPPSCQMLLFSATYDEDVMDFADALIANPVIIRLKKEEETLHNIRQYYVDCPSKESKYQAIANIYGVLTVGQSMIFCHTRHMANWLAHKMKTDGHAVALLTGELPIEERALMIKRFKDGLEKVLISTNVTARGIDVEQVTIVVNYDLPRTLAGKADVETYLHRIGRTGRFGKAGIAINLIDSDESRRLQSAIEQHFNITINKLDVEDIDEIEKISS